MAKFNIRKLAVLVLLSALFVLTGTATLMAQSTTEGAISGTVYDQAGAVVPNATIVVKNIGTNAEQTVTSDNSGYFRVTHLQPATYTVTVSASGFSSYKVSEAIVNIGSTTEIVPHLKPAGNEQTVEVTSEAPQVNTTSSEFAPVVDQTAISNLPINGGRWSNFAVLTPTVVQNGSGFGLVSVRGVSALLNNNTIDGADNNQAFFSEERGRTRAGYSTPKVAIQEFQVNTSNYSAEYGRSAGAVMNTVTKSGTNAYHGEMYFYDRDNSWGAFNPFTRLAVQSSPGVYTTVPYKPTDVRKIMGFGVGGPIIKDKLFFYLTFDRYYRNFPGTAIPSNPQTYFATPSATTAGTLATRLGVPLGTPTDQTQATAYGAYNYALNSLASMTGPVKRTGEQFIWLPKLDWQITNNNRVSVSLNRMRWASPAGIQTQASNSNGIRSFGDDYVKDTWIIARVTSTLSTNLINEFRYQWGRDFEFEPPQSPSPWEAANLVSSGSYTNPLGFPVGTSVSGFNFGVPNFLTRPKYPDERRQQWADTITLVKGNHNLKFGLDINHVNDDTANLRYQFGEYNYTTILDFASDLAKQKTCGTTTKVECFNRFTQGFGPLGANFSTNDYAFFVQDDWKILPRLSLTLGVRYEYEQMPSPYANLVNPDFPQTGQMPSDKNNIGPRIGFAWDVFADGKTSLRGGAGIYYGRVINSSIYNALINTGLRGGQLQFTYSPTTSGAPVFPQILNPAVTPSGASGTPSVLFFQPGFQNPQIHQADLSLEHEFPWNTVLKLTYLGSFGRHLPSFVDTNLAPSTGSRTFTVNGGPIAGTYSIPIYTKRVNTNYGPVSSIFSGVNSNYNALIMQLSKRMSHNLSFNVNLTYSRAFDYAQNEQTFTDFNDFLFPENISAAYGPSQYDVPLRFVFRSVATSPWKVTGPLKWLANGWLIAPVFQWQEGLPFSMAPGGSASGTANGGINGTGTGSGYTFAQGNYSAFSYIPVINGVGVGRNTFRGPNTYIFDLKLSKLFTFHDRYNLEFSGEAFNLLNHQNPTGIQSTGYLIGGTATAQTMTYCGVGGPCNNGPFGTITNSNSNFVYTPRQVQIGIRFQF